MMTRTIKRREFLKGVAGVTGASILAGCAPAATSAPAATAAPTEAAAPAVKYADQACVHHHLTGGFTGPGTSDEMIQVLEEQALRDVYKMNVDVTFESASWMDFDQLITTRLETQGCDSVERDGYTILNLATDEGLLQPVDALVDEYGPHIRDIFPQSAFDYYSIDGEAYSFSCFYECPVDCEYISIRRDWCDKIDRDVPQTIEDLEECLRLFKEKGLGGDVTIPIDSTLGGWLIPSYILQGPFAPDPDEQLALMDRGENFEYEYGCAMREERLELLRKWHQDGLLNPEWPTFKSEDNASAVAKGSVGCVFCGHWETNGQLLTTEREIDPTQDWVQIFPPVGLKGRPETARVLTEIPLGRAIAITSWANCPEAIISLTDWINSSFENFMLGTYGIEGEHWEFGENGCLVDLRSPAPNEEYSGMCHALQANKWLSHLRLLPADPANEPKDPLINQRIYGPHIYNRPQTTQPQDNEYPTLTRIFHFTPWKFTESSKFEADFHALRDEYATRIIKGEIGVSTGLQEFWDQWYAAGGDIRQQEITDQYAAYISQFPEMADPKIFLSPEYWNTEIKYPDRP
jgi:ABC-type glycerol-3-phosphate transport system substrate-binding protein